MRVVAHVVFVALLSGSPSDRHLWAVRAEMRLTKMAETRKCDVCDAGGIGSDNSSARLRKWRSACSSQSNKEQNPANKDQILDSIVVLEDEYAGTWYVDRLTTGSSRRKEIDGSMRQKTLAVAKRKA